MTPGQPLHEQLASLPKVAAAVLAMLHRAGRVWTKAELEARANADRPPTATLRVTNADKTTESISTDADVDAAVVAVWTSSPRRWKAMKLTLTAAGDTADIETNFEYESQRSDFTRLAVRVLPWIALAMFALYLLGAFGPHACGATQPKTSGGAETAK